MAEKKDHAWSRTHKNGRTALVFEHADWPGQFSAGATPSVGAKAMERGIGSLEKAKEIADADSGCTQPCSCPPWSE